MRSSGPGLGISRLWPVSARPQELILHTAAAAKLLDALEDNLLLAPIQSSVVPLPHQLYALNRAMSRGTAFATCWRTRWAWARPSRPG
jgi:hypothetical protein